MARGNGKKPSSKPTTRNSRSNNKALNGVENVAQLRGGRSVATSKKRTVPNATKLAAQKKSKMQQPINLPRSSESEKGGAFAEQEDLKPHTDDEPAESGDESEQSEATSVGGSAHIHTEDDDDDSLQDNDKGGNTAMAVKASPFMLQRRSWSSSPGDQASGLSPAGSTQSSEEGNIGSRV